MKTEQLLTDFIARNEREIKRLKEEVSNSDDSIAQTINKAMILAFETDLIWLRGMAELTGVQLNEPLPFTTPAPSEETNK